MAGHLWPESAIHSGWQSKERFKPNSRLWNENCLYHRLATKCSPPPSPTMSPISAIPISLFAFIVFITDVAAVNASLAWDCRRCSEGKGSWEVPRTEGWYQGLENFQAQREPYGMTFGERTACPTAFPSLPIFHAEFSCQTINSVKQ